MKTKNLKKKCDAHLITHVLTYVQRASHFNFISIFNWKLKNTAIFNVSFKQNIVLTDHETQSLQHTVADVEWVNRVVLPFLF